MIAKLDAQVEDMMEPFRAQRDLLITIPGIGHISSAVVISEIGDDVADTISPPPNSSRPGPGCAQATTNPPASGIRGKRRRATSTCSPGWSNAHGPPYAPTATCAVLPKTGPRVRRVPQRDRQEESHRRRRSQTRHDHLARARHRPPYEDLGADYFTTRIDPEKEKNRLIAKLQAQGYTVTLEPAA